MTIKQTDNGLKKAIGKQPVYRLPSNFTHRMMQQVREEAIQREQRTEKRVFILWIITLILMGAGGLGFVVWNCGTRFIEMLSVRQEELSQSPSSGFYLSSFLIMLLLGSFNHWLNRRGLHKE